MSKLKLFRVRWEGRAIGQSYVPALTPEEALDKAKKGYDINFEQDNIRWEPVRVTCHGDYEHPPTQAERQRREPERDNFNDRGEPLPHPSMEPCDCPPLP